MRKNKLLFTLLILLCAQSGHAERGDSEQPVNVDADRVLIDNAKQISTFEGRVMLSQGTMVMRADKLVVVQDAQGMKHSTAYGHPASFRQKREGLDEYVEGFAERIEYDMDSDVVDFFVQARVKRSQDDLRGDHITYNAKSETFQAAGSKVAGGEAPTRVHAVLHPKAKSQSDGQGGEPATVKPGQSEGRK